MMTVGSLSTGYGVAAAGIPETDLAPPPYRGPKAHGA
jgi:hypothetical protein